MQRTGKKLLYSPHDLVAFLEGDFGIGGWIGSIWSPEQQDNAEGIGNWSHGRIAEAR